MSLPVLSINSFQQWLLDAKQFIGCCFLVKIPSGCPKVEDWTNGFHQIAQNNDVLRYRYDGKTLVLSNTPPKLEVVSITSEKELNVFSNARNLLLSTISLADDSLSHAQLLVPESGSSVVGLVLAMSHALVDVGALVNVAGMIINAVSEGKIESTVLRDWLQDVPSILDLPEEEAVPYVQKVRIRCDAALGVQGLDPDGWAYRHLKHTFNIEDSHTIKKLARAHGVSLWSLMQASMNMIEAKRVLEYKDKSEPLIAKSFWVRNMRDVLGMDKRDVGSPVGIGASCAVTLDSTQSIWSSASQMETKYKNDASIKEIAFPQNFRLGWSIGVNNYGQIDGFISDKDSIQDACVLADRAVEKENQDTRILDPTEEGGDRTTPVLILWAVQNQLSLVMPYCPMTYKEETITTMMGELVGIMEALIHEEDVTWAKFKATKGSLDKV